MIFSKEMKRQLIASTNPGAAGCIITFEIGEYSKENFPAAYSLLYSFWTRVICNKTNILKKYFDGFIRENLIIKNNDLYKPSIQVFGVLKEGIPLNLPDLKTKMKIFYMRTLMLTEINENLKVNIKPVNVNNYLNNLTSNGFKDLVNNSEDEEFLFFKSFLKRKKMIAFYGCFNFSMNSVRKHHIKGNTDE